MLIYQGYNDQKFAFAKNEINMGFRDITFLKIKGGGAQDGGDQCGVYTALLDDEKRTFLAKREPTPGKNACELAASLIANALHQYVSTNIRHEEDKEFASEHRSERFAVVKTIPADLLRTATQTSKNPKKSEEKETYVASLFASKKSKDFWDFAYEQYLKNNEVFKKLRVRNRHEYLEKPTKRPKFLGTDEPKTVFDTVMAKIVERNPHFLQEFSDARTVNFIIGNFDNHIGNLVISHDSCNQCEGCDSEGICKLPPLENIHLHSIDFAGAFDPAYKKFNDFVFPVRKGGHNPQPTNHNDEYSRRWKITDEMARACEHYILALKAIGQDLAQHVAREVVMHFDFDEVLAYTQRLMESSPKQTRNRFTTKLNSLRGIPVKTQFLLETIASCLLDNFVKRAIPQCEQEMFEIELSLCFSPKHKTRPELGFKVNRKRMVDFFKKMGTTSAIEQRIKTTKFRMIGQEDFLHDLQNITLNILNEIRQTPATLLDSPDLHASAHEKKSSLKLLKKHQQHSALLKHGLFKEPANQRTHSPVSLKKRLRNAIFDIYELSHTSSMWARVRKVLGWPPIGMTRSLPSIIRNLIIKPLYFIVMLPRTLAKMTFELLPEAGAQLFEWMRDHSLHYLKDKNNSAFANPLSLIKHIVAGAVFIAAGAVAPAFKIARQVGMRISSPVRSFKEAYRFGKTVGDHLGTPVGYFLGSMAALTSMAISAVGIFATSAIVTPLVLGGLTAMGLGSVSTWLTGAATSLSSYLGLSTATQTLGSTMGVMGLASTTLSLLSGMAIATGSFVKGLWQGAKKLKKICTKDIVLNEASISLSTSKSYSSTARLPFNLERNAYGSQQQTVAKSASTPSNHSRPTAVAPRPNSSSSFTRLGKTP